MTETEFNDIVKFSKAFYDIGSGAYSPFTQNQNLKSLTIGNGITISYEDIKKNLEIALQDETNLQLFSNFMSLYDTIYDKTISYYKSILSFDYRWYCTNAHGKEFNSKEFKRDEQKVKDFFNTFDVIRELRNKVLPILLKNGSFYGWYRDSQAYLTKNKNLKIVKTKNKTIQIMPRDYCKLTNYSEFGGMYDFDLSYMFRENIDPCCFDPYLIKKMVESRDKKYVPHLNGKYRNGDYALWTQTDQEHGAFCILFDESNFNELPPFASLMKACYNNTKVGELQMEKNLASAWAVLYGSIGTLNGEKIGQKADQFKLNPQTVKMFLRLVQESLNSIVKVVGMPLDDTRMGQFTDSNKGLVQDNLRNSGGQGAFGSALIFNENATSQSVIQNALLMDYERIKVVYKPLARYLTEWVNKYTDKYKFKVVLDGSNFIFERESRQKALTDLANKGLVLNASAWASAYGYEPTEFISSLEQSHYGKLDNMLTQMINLNTMTQKENGRPSKDANEISDNGETSKDYK